MISSHLIVQLEDTSSFKIERAMMAKNHGHISLPLEMDPHRPQGLGRDFKHPNFFYQIKYLKLMPTLDKLKGMGP